MTYEDQAIENIKKEITEKNSDILDKVHDLADDAIYNLGHCVLADLSGNNGYLRALDDVNKLSEMTNHDE